MQKRYYGIGVNTKRTAVNTSTSIHADGEVVKIFLMGVGPMSSQHCVGYHIPSELRSSSVGPTDVF